MMRSRSTLRGLRTVQLTIAVSMLAVPASALALTNGSAPIRTTRTLRLPVHVTPRRVAFGQPVHVRGQARRAAAGERVVLETAPRAHAHWRVVAGTRVGRRGRFSFRTRLRHSGVLRAVAIDHTGTERPTAADGGSSVAAALAVVARPARASAISRVAPVKVSARIDVSHRSRAVLAGHELAVAGRVLPGRAGRRVAVQAHAGHSWRTVAHARTAAHGRFTARFAAPAGPNRQLRVVFGGDHANAAATGAAGSSTAYVATVASWYYDYASTGCGFHAGLGVANKTLPCGTKVQLRYGGRTVTATVDDRGPYVYGRSFDLNQNTAAALHFAGVGTIETSVR